MLGALSPASKRIEVPPPLDMGMLNPHRTRESTGTAVDQPQDHHQKGKTVTGIWTCPFSAMGQSFPRRRCCKNPMTIIVNPRNERHRFWSRSKQPHPARVRGEKSVIDSRQPVDPLAVTSSQRQ